MILIGTSFSAQTLSLGEYKIKASVLIFSFVFSIRSFTVLNFRWAKLNRSTITMSNRLSEIVRMPRWNMVSRLSLVFFSSKLSLLLTTDLNWVSFIAITVSFFKKSRIDSLLSFSGIKFIFFFFDIISSFCDNDSKRNFFASGLGLTSLLWS